MAEAFLDWVACGDQSKVEAYLAGGGDVEYRARSDRNNKDVREGDTGLTLAASHNKVEIMRELFCCGADIEGKNSIGSTALMIASERGHVDIVRLLLERNADINVRHEDGWTALMIAASERGHVDIVRLLLERNADINLQNKNGGTALMIASAKGHADIVTLIENQSRWSRRKHLIMMLVEIEYLPSSSVSPTSSLDESYYSRLDHLTVLGNPRLVRHIVSYI